MPVSVCDRPANQWTVNDPILNLLILPVIKMQTMDTFDLNVLIESDLINNFVVSLLSAICNTLQSEAKGGVDLVAS